MSSSTRVSVCIFVTPKYMLFLDKSNETDWWARSTVYYKFSVELRWHSLKGNLLDLDPC